MSKRYYNTKTLTDDEQRARFWSQVARTDDLFSCWLWTGPVNKANGYGKTNMKRVAWWAHRLSYFLTYGPIPKGLHVLHRCDVRLCTRGSHLFAGTPADNMRDAAAKDRIGHGVNHWNTKLTVSQVAEIRALYAAGGISMVALGSRYGICGSHVWFIVHRLNWKRLP